MRNWIYFIGGLLFCASSMNAQEMKDTLFKHYTISKKGLGEFEIHVTKTETGKKKPLIVYLDGSGNFPLYYRNKNGRTSSSIAINIRKYYKDYIIAIISKPGTPFYDSLRFTESGRAYYPENDQYRQLYSLDWRAQSASATINYS